MYNVMTLECKQFGDNMEIITRGQGNVQVDVQCYDTGMSAVR